MNRDGIYSNIYMDDPNRVIYIERWKDDPLPYDDIDTDALRNAAASLFPTALEDEDDDINISMNAANSGAKVFKNHRLRLEPEWLDLCVFDKFRDEHLELHQIHDGTILQPFHSVLRESKEDSEGESRHATIALFLANGMAMEDESMREDTSNETMRNFAEDVSLSSGINSSFSHLRASSAVHAGMLFPSGANMIPHSAQTPRMTRRGSSDRAFETPLARIIR